MYIDTVGKLDWLINLAGGGIHDSDKFPHSPEMSALGNQYTAAVRASEAGRSGEAILGYEHILQQWPTFVAARVNISNLLMKADRLDEAVKHIEAALEVTDKDPDVYIHAGLLYGALGDPISEVAMYQRAHRLDMHNKDALFNLVITYRQLRWWTVARAWLEVVDGQIRPFLANPLTPVDPRRIFQLESNWALINEHYGKWKEAAASWDKCYQLTRDESYRVRSDQALKSANTYTS